MKALLKKAWLIQWGFHGQDEEKLLEKFGIKNKVVDFFNTRKSYKDMCELVKDIYKRERLSFTEKMGTQHYTLGLKNQKNMFGHTIPITTCYQSDLYRELIECMKNQGLKSAKYKELIARWDKYPKYIVVGHNPYLEAKLVFNLRVLKQDDGQERLEWEEEYINGERKKNSYGRGY